MEKTTARPEKIKNGQGETGSAASDPIPVALDFLRSCREEGRPLAFLSGAPGTGKSMLMHRLLREIGAAPVAHLKRPTDDVHAFLGDLLAGFGFEEFESTASDLFRLAKVYMLHESRKGERPVVIVENVEQFGPSIWGAIRELAAAEADEPAVALFVLTGSPGFASRAIAPAFDSVYSLDVTIRTSAPRDCAVIEVYFQDRPLGLHRLDRPKTAVGRSGANDIHISSAFVSRFHALLVNEGGANYVVDLHSTNGTYVNGERVTRRRLRAGDVIGLEEFTLRYRAAVDEAGEGSEGDAADTLLMQAPLDHLLDRSA